MTSIIAGMFDTADKAASAVDDLLNGEFRDKDVCSFANNPPGQHATYPIGGDEHKDPGARHADADAGKGAAVGLGTGAAIGAVTAGPPGAAVGAGIGAYVGSLVGALHGMRGSGTPEHPNRRPAGTLVAVRIESGNAEQAAITKLQTHGAIHIEKAEGLWRDGQWIDFDPVSEPVIVESTSSEVSRQSAEQKEK
jgi:hypothetical protein